MFSMLSTTSFGCIRSVGTYCVLFLCYLLGSGVVFIGLTPEVLARDLSSSVSTDAVSDTILVSGTKYEKRTRIAAKTPRDSHSKLKRASKLRSRNNTLNGPLLIIVSLAEQRLHVYKAGSRIASSKISSGQIGHRTPTGIFTILQKRRRHYSNIYRGAAMPYMQRLTWSGIALHAGFVPNYPASHGCIRLPKYFARKLYRQTKIGDHVIIGHEMGVPERIQHANLFQPTSFATLTKPGLRNSTNSKELFLRSSIKSTKVDQDRRGAIATPTYRIAYRHSFSSAKSESSDRLSDDRIRQISIMQMDIETSIFRRQLIAKKVKSPLRILIAQKTEKDRIEDAQRMLNQLGFDSGSPDGVVGKRTMQAVADFQAANGLEIDGVLSDPILKKIGLAAGYDLTKNGYIHVRQKYKDILKADVNIENASDPLGTHLFAAMGAQEHRGKFGWTAMTIQERSVGRGATRKNRKRLSKPLSTKEISSSEALSRVDIPVFVKTFISDRLTPGSSMIISNNGKSHETSKYTDFIVLTK